MTDDPLEARLAARRNRAARNRLLLLVVLVAATGAVAAVGVTLALNRHRDDGAAPTTKGGVQPSGRPPVATPVGNTGKPRGEWNHADLAAHLKAKGVEVRVEGAGAGPGSTLASLLADGASGQKVFALLAADDRAATDLAASQGANAFPWGRFVIEMRLSDDAVFYRRVRDALR